MTTFVGYDYLVTRKNGENGGKMKMKGVGEFLGKIVSYPKLYQQQQKHQKARSIEATAEAPTSTLN